MDDALKAKQSMPDIDQDALNGILANLNRATQQAKNTVDSINGAIELINRALDGLVMLVKVAAKFAA